MDNKDLIARILGEARHYENFTDIEKLVEQGGSLANVPLQPLHHALQNTSEDILALVLPKLSPEQRQAMIDLDFWKKDVVDVQGFEHWLVAYARCKEDQIVSDFVKSEDFLLYLKARVNIWTFDVEDPQYPDHDYYFLTDDNLLLVEYSDNYNYLAEIKYLVKTLYSELGVENAYSLLFKLINDNFSVLQEDSYQQKKERLREFGMVDYYEAKESLHPFATQAQLRKFVLNKVQFTGSLESTHLNQKLPASSLVAFEKESSTINAELAKVQSDTRLDFLSFSFVRTINASLVCEDALSASRPTLLAIGKHTRCQMELGIEYVREQRNLEEQSVLDFFDFSELVKIGRSLQDSIQRKLKSALKNTAFEQEDKEYFLGSWWNLFLDQSFEWLPICRNFGVGLHPLPVNNLEVFNFWSRQAHLFVGLMPFITTFHNTLNKLIEDQKLSDDFYLNYQVDSIDFEAILLSSLINFDMGKTGQKMGITIDEFKQFIKKYSNLREAEYHLKPMSELQDLLDKFSHQFGFEVVEGFGDYLYGILFEHVSGYEYDQLGFQEFEHVGGPILLRSLPN